MVRLVLRLLYNVTVYPIALAVWSLRRRLILRRTRCAKLRLTRMPPVGSGRRVFRRGSLADLARDLDHAAADPLLNGLFVSLDGFTASVVDFLELTSLFERFKQSGKRLHVFVERVDWRSLVAARAADRLTTDPSGPVMVHGLGLEVPFIGELLDRHGIAFQVRQRGEYKGALEPFVRRDPSAALLESLRGLVDSLFERAADEIAKRPGADLAQARTALEEGPYTVAQAVDRRLVDAALSAEQAENDLAQACGASMRSPAERQPRAPEKGAPSAGSLEQLPLFRRAGIVRPARLALTTPARIAFVPLSGLIVDRPIRVTGQATVATELVPRIRSLADARAIDAIVLVIDSRGGTASASDMIWNAIRYALAKKPVVAWMRSYAASGGYYVAVAAERIIASPFTITGSIGVVASKPNVARAAERLGIRSIAVTRGGGALLFSPFRPFSDHELTWLDAYLDETYRRFTAIVADCRRMAPDAVEQVAGGRIWTGAQAHERGLVDQLGVLSDVVDAARELAAIPARRPHEITWAAPREGLLRIAQRLAMPAAAWLPSEFDTLVELLRVTRQREALYYMPVMWQEGCA